MNSRDKPAFAQLFLTVSKVYKREFCESTLEIYWWALADFTFEDVKSAFEKHIANTNDGRFMPLPANLRCYLLGDSNAQALFAWTKVQLAIRSVGAYESITFDDPIIHWIIVDKGGWIQLCKLTEHDLKFYQAEFVKRYAAYSLKCPSTYPSHLVGVLEHQNTMQGYPIPEPFLMGDEPLAKMTYEQGMHPSESRKYLQANAKAVASYCPQLNSPLEEN